MLFQMCYGPEIESLYAIIQKYPGMDLNELTKLYQYQSDSNITSLIQAALIVLKELDFIVDRESRYYASSSLSWSKKETFKRLKEISKKKNNTIDDLNIVFSTIYEELFVKPNRMYIENMHYHINKNFEATQIGIEKVNAWKRVMECWGIGRRVYSGFYALPHRSLMIEVLNDLEQWEGSLQLFCEKNVDPIFPCISSEQNVFKGVLFSLASLHENGDLTLTYKQDLPHKSYGPDGKWNWIEINNRGAI